MNYQHLSTVLSVLSATQPQHQEIVLVNQLNDFFGFDHNIFLIASPDVDRFIDTRSQSDRVPRSIIRFNGNGMKGIPKIDGKSPLVIVVMEGVCLDCNPSFRQILVDMHRMQRNMKIGVFISAQFASRGELRKFFVWCWDHGIADVFVTILEQSVEAYGSSYEPLLRSFTFDPFVNFRVIEIPTGALADQFFPNQNGNYKLQPLRFPGGYQSMDEIISIFCKWMNASKRFTYHSTGIDIHPDLPLFSTSRQLKGLKAYPVSSVTDVIIVPKSLPYPAFLAYFRSMAVDSIIAICVGVFVLLIAIVAAMRYAKCKKLEIFQSTLDVFNLLIHDNSTINYQKLVPAEIALIVPLTFAGFLISNVVLSIIISFFCRPHMQPEVDSFENLYKSNVKIVVPNIAHNFPMEKIVLNVLNDNFNQYDWSSKILLLSESVVANEMFSRNPSMAFVCGERFARTFIEAQKRLELPGYRIPAEVPVISKRLQSYWVNESFPFIERVNELCHLLHTFGFYQKWDNDEIFHGAKWLGRRQSQYVSVTTEDAIPAIIFHCWILSVLVFILELIWERLKLWIAERRESQD